ncbi:hypothetical protein [Lentzea sp.]|uniref:hypothetical protein n=1 Tax=Lentzea sp. TaxID=56099 RepID=UPI002BE65469|nr:hypothetical protein [Lentzea sp.]HUQ56899.1 hypothetical protein [Lentzea sp.]
MPNRRPFEWITGQACADRRDSGNTLSAMETQDTTTLSALAERLGWRRRASAGVHLVDLLVGRTVVDLIAVLAENRDGPRVPVSAFPQSE